MVGLVGGCIMIMIIVIVIIMIIVIVMIIIMIIVIIIIIIIIIIIHVHHVPFGCKKKKTALNNRVHQQPSVYIKQHTPKFMAGLLIRRTVEK